MNIFFLSYDPKEAAQFHNDKHVVKMILETAQLLSTAHAVLNNAGKQVEGMYKPTHKNHPCAVWVRESYLNYRWALSLLRELLKEYEHRYNKFHKTKIVFEKLEMFPQNIPLEFNSEITLPALAMPEQYKQIDPVQAYRDYYMGEKSHIAKWTHREIPIWW